MQNEIDYQITHLPEFSKIEIKNIVPTLSALIAEYKALKARLLTGENNYSWNNFIQPLDEQEEKLNQMFSPVRHLSCVANSEALRNAYEKSIELLIQYSTEKGQDKALYEAYKYVYHHDGSLDFVQKKALKDILKAFEHSGVSLPKEQRDQFKKLKTELSKLTNNFENNVLDATMGWVYHTQDPSQLTGLPKAVVSAAKTKAQEKGKTGYILGLDMPTYLAVMMHAENRNIRETFYYEYCTRASDQGSNAGKWDNADNIAKILELRNKEALLLGFGNYAELSLDEKMASSVFEVEKFLKDLLFKSKPQAKQELKVLQEFATKLGFENTLETWDVAFYSEKLKQEKFNFSDEDLRDYFPLSKVLAGLYKIIKTIYGLDVKAAIDYDTYHSDVKLLEFYDACQVLRGKIYIDLFSRDHKRGGAWMDECRVRFRRLDGEIQIPVAYVNANFMPPQKNMEPTLTHNDVLTLFHEFGHALHHILTKVNYVAVSGINGVEWDAVELPSQFMENFCWEREGLNLISGHIQTGVALPETMLIKLKESRCFQSGMQMIRQLEFSLLDLELHRHYPINVQEIIDEVRKNVSVLLPPRYNRFQNSFTHIFSGGYAAGYYSYKWAEVLSSDAFSKFEQASTILSKVVGREFLEKVLEKGGSKPASELFKDFRGRQPEIGSLLRHSGINEV